MRRNKIICTNLNGDNQAGRTNSPPPDDDYIRGCTHMFLM